ncbi:NADPH-dependent FMN reductase-domain-containing protein [Xylariaceae sp. FL0255]|nr:NADPH-dependent FMN reductase-domain-containing protein [Xylariaceae sp. FL0255]
MSKLFRVAIVIGSQRAVRVCPQISQFVLDVVKTQHKPAPDAGLDFSFLDIADYKLPLTDETGIPVQLTDLPAAYDAESTRAWSRAVASYDAFVFVTPQYNWGVPAGLKNAIDHLYNEWKGKPAMVVSYGGHGGGVSAAALITVLSGMGLLVVRRPVCLAFPGREFTGKAFKGLSLDLDASSESSAWADRRGDIAGLWEETYGVLVGTHQVPATKQEGLLEVWRNAIPPLPVPEQKKD